MRGDTLNLVPYLLCCLPPLAGIKFNVVMFGSSHQFMYPACVPYSEETAAAAEAWVQANVNSNWGGTEILGTLEAIFSVPVSQGAPRQTLPALCSCLNKFGGLGRSGRA